MKYELEKIGSNDGVVKRTNFNGSGLGSEYTFLFERSICQSKAKFIQGWLTKYQWKNVDTQNRRGGGKNEHVKMKRETK